MTAAPSPASKPASPQCIIPSNIIKTYAEAVGVNNMPEDALTVVAQDVEYRIRELVQQATKYAHHERREKLTIEDLNRALEDNNAEPVYGYDSMEALSFRAVPNTAGLFYVPNEEVDVEAALKQAPPPAPLPPLTLTKHWLAIEGVQPAIPENPTPADVAAMAAGREHLPVMPSSRKELQEDAEIKALARHSLSKELQMLYDNLVEALFQSSDAGVALKIISEDAGIQPLLPYMVQLAAEMMTKWAATAGKGAEGVAVVCIRLLQALLGNRALFPEPYLHQMMPVILTGLLVQSPASTNEQVRAEAAHALQLLCGLYADSYVSLVPRCCKTLTARLSDSNPGTLLGAVLGLSALGPVVVQSCLVPHIASVALTDGSVRKALKDALVAWSPHASVSVTEEQQRAIQLILQ